MEVVFQQTVLTDYREGFHRLLSQRHGQACGVCCGDEDYFPSLQTAESARDLIFPVTNRYLLGRRFLWQSGEIDRLCEADLAILNFNLRTLSNWWILLYRRLRRRKTLLWGHLSGRSSLTRRFGFCQIRLASGFLTYTETQREEFRGRYPELPCWAARNACLPADLSHSGPPDSTAPRSILFVGRLVERKKPMLLLLAFARMVKGQQEDGGCTLEFVGEGPERQALLEAAKAHGVEHRVVFHGHVTEVRQLAQLYRQAIVSVSPGYVGLSAIQSFAFGITMLIAQDEPHSPEIEACIEGETARFFPSDDADALAALLEQCVADLSSFDEAREEVSAFAREKYTFESMCDAFLEAIAAMENEPVHRKLQ